MADASVLTRLVEGSAGALIPGLVQYARETGAVANLRKIFAANPALGNSVLAELARDASNTGLILSLAGDEMRPTSGDVPAWQTQLLGSLIERGDYAKAHRLWQKISGLQIGKPGLFNPQFAEIAAPAPFNWTFGSGKFGLAEPAASDQLQVIYYGRDDGQFASQLLVLEPGTYQLRMQVARDGPSEEPSGLSWAVICQPGAKQLLSLPLGRAEGRAGAITGIFTVPQNCPSQQLALNGISREFAKSEQVKISDLQLVGSVR
jgi:hypothetical protein